VALIGNPDGGLKALTILEVDYSKLDAGLPPILGYESKWEPDSPYWTQIQYKETTLPASTQRMLVEYASRLFERLRCRDYARFDFRANAAGEIKLLEVNPNPGWCWDGKMNLMANMAGLRYSEFLGLVLEAATSRLRDVLAPRVAAASAKAAAAE
jgi:D-alanine-D-alanine ligase